MDKKAKKWGYSYYHPGYFRDMGDNGLTYEEAKDGLAEALKDTVNGYGFVFYAPDADEV